MLHGRKGWKSCGLALAIAAVMVVASGAHATDLPLTGWIVKVTADKGSLHDEYVRTFSGQTLPPSSWFDWDLIADGGGVYTFANGLGQLQSLNLSLGSDPASVSLGFSLVAGASGADFTVTSAILPTGSVLNPEAWASAGVTVTDGEPFDTATLLGLFPGSKVFQAKYNEIPWKTLVPSPATTGPGGTELSSEMYPATPGSAEVIPATVTSISTEFKFRLTPADQASGTSNFALVIPEPATLTLLAIGLAAARRRR